MPIRSGLHGLLDAGMDALSDLEEKVDGGLHEISEHYAIPDFMEAAEGIMRSWQRVMAPKAKEPEEAPDEAPDPPV